MLEAKPIIYIDKPTFKWVTGMHRQLDLGALLMLGTTKGWDKHTITKGIVLKSNGGCDDSNRIDADDIIMTIEFLDRVNIIPLAILCLRESIPDEGSGTVSHNIDRFMEQFPDFPYIVLTEYSNRVWRVNKLGRKVMSLLGHRNDEWKGGEITDGKKGDQEDSTRKEADISTGSPLDEGHDNHKG